MTSALIVETSEPMRRMLRSMLSDLIEIIYECRDCTAALSIVASYRPDWILIDMGIMEDAAIAATRQITAAFPDARIIVIGTYDHTDLRDAALTAGAIGYVLTENLVDLRTSLTAGR